MLEGTIHNDGWISNSTIQADAELIGGIVTGTIINHGTLKDFEFRGASVTGGTLAGTINNNSQMGGLFQEVSLAPNTRISGGGLQGIIAGDANAPARLDNVEIRENSQLSGVQLADTVQLGDNVDVTELLPDLPSQSDCDIALLTQKKRMDLSNAVFESGDGLLNAINELPYFKDNHWAVVQNAYEGYLQLTIEVLRVAVQPQSVISTNRSAALDLLALQQVRFITDNGMAILAQPAVQAPCTLQTALAELGLADAILQQNGNLRIFATDEYGYSARPDWLAIERDEVDEVTPGLFLGESPFISGIVLAYVVFVDEDGIARQQFFYPAPVVPEDLYSAAENVVVTDEGLVSLSLDGQHYYGVLDYLVIKDTPPTQNHLQIESIRDINGDGKEDWVLIYPSGERQILFQRLP